MSHCRSHPSFSHAWHIDVVDVRWCLSCLHGLALRSLGSWLGILGFDIATFLLWHQSAHPVLFLGFLLLFPTDGLLGTWHTSCLVTPLFTAAWYDASIPLISSWFFCSNALIALARSLCKCLLAVLITASEADAVTGFLVRGASPYDTIPRREKKNTATKPTQASNKTTQKQKKAKQKHHTTDLFLVFVFCCCFFACFFFVACGGSCFAVGGCWLVFF